MATVRDGKAAAMEMLTNLVTLEVNLLVALRTVTSVTALPVRLMLSETGLSTKQLSNATSTLSPIEIGEVVGSGKDLDFAGKLAYIYSSFHYSKPI